VGALQSSVWSLDLQVGITTIITFIVRSVYTRRIWFLSNILGATNQEGRLLAVVISLFSLAQLVIGLGLCVLTFVVKRFEELPKYLVPISVQLSCAVAADLLITSALVYIYDSSRTGMRNSNSMLNTLILWSMNTGLITGMFELLSLLTWVSMPNRLIFIIFHLVVGKLYTSSLLAMINGRETLAVRNIPMDIDAGVLEPC